jgi:hypothetical protein
MGGTHRWDYEPPENLLFSRALFTRARRSALSAISYIVSEEFPYVLRRSGAGAEPLDAHKLHNQS